MKTIRISWEVWEAIRERGEMGETPDDVLRKVFALPAAPTRSRHRGRLPQRATRRMSVKVVDGTLRVCFRGDQPREWQLPEKRDKEALKEVWDAAIAFAVEHGASYGQVVSIKSKLNRAGYHLTR